MTNNENMARAAVHKGPPISSTPTMIIMGYPAGFGAQIKNTVIGFLYAEVLNRYPIVIWRDWCLYFDANRHCTRNDLHSNAFFDFFEPLSGLETARFEELKINAFFPNQWMIDNVLSQVDFPFNDADRKNPNISLPENFDFNPPEDTSIVYSHYKELNNLLPRIPASHRLYGMSHNEVLYTLYQDHFRLRQKICREIDHFWEQHTNEKPILGIHYRGTDKGVEAPVISVRRYMKLICEWQKHYPDGQIFLATDCGKALEKFKSKFEKVLFYWDYPRSHDGKPLHYESDNPSTRGREIIRDCYCLSRCDFKILNSRSNVAHWITQCLVPPNRIDSCDSVSPSLAAVLAFKLRQFRFKNGSRLKRALKRIEHWLTKR